MEEFNVFTEDFEIPEAGQGQKCTVRGQRENFIYNKPDGNTEHKYDFLVYFLNGDCNGDEEVTLTI